MPNGHPYTRSGAHTLCSQRPGICVRRVACPVHTYVYMPRMTEQYNSNGGGAFRRKGVYHIYRFNKMNWCLLCVSACRSSLLRFPRCPPILYVAQLLFCVLSPLFVIRVYCIFGCCYCCCRRCLGRVLKCHRYA